MNVQQLFDLYAAQDVRSFNIAKTLRNRPDLLFNDNSLVFFVFHFLDEYEP